MGVDGDLFEKVREAGERLERKQHELGLAVADYHHAVRRLHLAGASLREIASVLQISHQRVHQMVEAAGGVERRWKGTPATPPDVPPCSFCGRPSDEVDRLIAGPGVYVCNHCVDVANGLVSGALDRRPEHLVLDRGGLRLKRSCSFCQQAARGNVHVIAGPGVQVCTLCLDLCNEIIAEEHG